MGENCVVCKDHLVQCAIVRNDSSNIAPDIPQICQGQGRVAISDDFVVGSGHCIVQFTGFESGIRELVPPANIDDGVRKAELLDVVVDNFFLLKKKQKKTLEMLERSSNSMAENYLVPQPHDTTGWCDGDETAGDESLNTGLLRCVGDGDLVLLFCRTDTADYDIDIGQRLLEFLFCRFQVTFANVHSLVLQGENGRFLSRTGPNKGVDFLYDEGKSEFCCFFFFLLHSDHIIAAQ